MQVMRASYTKWDDISTPGQKENNDSDYNTTIPVIFIPVNHITTNR